MTELMAFDFQKAPQRKGSASLKWQRYEQQDVIPMWVADMDLSVPPVVVQALSHQVTQGALGYGEVSDALVQAFIDWCQVEYAWTVDPQWLVWLPGVVPGLHLAVEALVPAQVPLWVQAPVYPPILNLGQVRQRPQHTLPLDHPLDELLDAMAQAPQSALVLCHPQNPTGQCYDPAFLRQLASEVAAIGGLVISDEIWADLTLAPDHRHTPFASVSEAAANCSITLMAPSKTFNIAGLSCAVAVIPNPALRQPFKQAARGLMPDMNYLGLIAAQAAWQGGRPWLKALKQHLNAQLDRLDQWVAQHPKIRYQRPQATYVAWLDVSQLGLSDPHQAFLDAGVALSPGGAFGDERFVRLNVGCPAAQLQAALDRMHRVAR